jgi:hypothetical protein
MVQLVGSGWKSGGTYGVDVLESARHSGNGQLSVGVDESPEARRQTV